MCRAKLVGLAVLPAVLALPAVVGAQAVVPDVLKLNYFDNANLGGPDQTVRITNAGTNYANVVTPPVNGDLCAMIYVYRPDQELTECCGCRVTPNALLKLSVNNNLTANPLNGGPPTAGMITIVSAAPTTTPGPVNSSKVCDPTFPSVVPTAGIRAWGTHLQDGGAITETEFTDAGLSATQLTVDSLSCLLITGALIPPGLGSGHGTCDCTDVLSGKLDP
jgi:hypothetical protein